MTDKKLKNSSKIFYTIMFVIFLWSLFVCSVIVYKSNDLLQNNENLKENSVSIEIKNDNLNKDNILNNTEQSIEEIKIEKEESEQAEEKVNIESMFHNY